MAGSYSLNQGWLFGGEYASGSAEPGYDDSGFSEVTLPHTVVPLSWGGPLAGGGDNVLAVIVDARCLAVSPAGRHRS